MLKTSFLLIALTITLSFLGCNSKKSTLRTTKVGSELLYQYQWNLTRLKHKNVIDTNIKLSFFPGKVSSVSGNTGCNNFRGTFELSETNNIKFSALATTKMACLGKNYEAEFLQMMEEANQWEIDNDQLILKRDHKILAKFKSQQP
ncbi:META domain-containing protein [Pelobium sp.]|nr:META domain-containing protein [Pelobium sp.]MDA9554969.1 META domain-containing protein [Pelobium sp.]